MGSKPTVAAVKAKVKSGKLNALLGELVRNIPPPNGDLQWSLDRNRLLQEQLVLCVQACGEQLFPGINDMIALLAGKERELLGKVGPQC